MLYYKCRGLTWSDLWECNARQIQSMAWHVQEAEAKAREAAGRAAAEHRAKVAASKLQRKKRTQVMRKRTSSGQPVMKHRIEGMLSTLQND